MALSRAKQRQIMRDDAKRRNARAAADLEAIVASHSPLPTVDPYHVSRGITGEASPNNRVHRVSDNCWDTMLVISDGHVKRMGATRAIGYTRKNDIGSILPNTVKVTRNGVTTVVPASSFRKERNVTTRVKAAQVSHTLAASDCASMAATVGFIGNVE